MKNFIKEFIVFGYKQARSCVFAGSFLVLVFASNYLPLFGLARYDFLFISAIVLQVILVATKLETKDEVKTILLFHIVGFVLEVYKTQPEIGSWSYPEEGFFKISTVPLYSGFLYSAVGSYISQSWKILKLRVYNYPKYFYSITICILIYLNFFTHHFIPDFRWWLAAAVFVIFWKTKVYYIVLKKERSMPLVLSFILIGFFIWIAENLFSYYGAWKYPYQLESWSFVSMGKISSWALLVIISFIIVADLKQFKSARLANKPEKI